MGASYRYLKNFSLNYIVKFKKKKLVGYKIFVRKLNLNILRTIIDNKFGNVLIKKHAYERKNIASIIELIKFICYRYDCANW
jgi:hypothetical protein